jgi:hypothetical protein
MGIEVSQNQSLFLAWDTAINSIHVLMGLPVIIRIGRCYVWYSVMVLNLLIWAIGYWVDDGLQCE